MRIAEIFNLILNLFINLILAYYFFNNSLRDGDVYTPKSLGLGKVAIERNALPYKKATITLAREHAYDYI